MRKWISVVVGLSIIFFLQPLDAQTWSKTKRLTDNLGDSEAPDIAIDSSNAVHIVFHDDTPDWTHDEIFYKRSTNGGTSWTTKRLTWNPDQSSYPAIAIDSADNIHVVWQDLSPGNYEIYYRKSTNGGTTWSSTKRLTFNDFRSANPKVAVDSSGNIYVVWKNYVPGGYEIYFKESTDGGSTWTTKRLTYNSDYSEYPDIAVDSNNYIHVVWSNQIADFSEIFYKSSTDGGNSWMTKRLSWNTGFTEDPCIIIDSSDNLHLVWDDYAHGAPEIYYKKSVYGGTSWSATKRLTWVDSACFSSKIASDPNNRIHVVWSSGYDPDYDIFYKRSTNYGGTWTTKRLTWIPGGSWKLAVAVAPNNNIYVVWQDENLGNWEIYFKKGIQ